MSIKENFWININMKRECMKLIYNNILDCFSLIVMLLVGFFLKKKVYWLYCLFGYRIY